MTAPRENIQRLHAYVPGEQPTWRDTAAPVEPVIKLNTNENPYPPPPAVLEAIRQLPGEALRLYPPPRADRFRAVAGKMLGLSAEHILATNGGDELLRLLVTTFCNPSAKARTGADRIAPAGTISAHPPTPAGVGMTRPSYSLYSVLADIHDTPLTVVDRDPKTLAPPPAEALADAWNAAGCKLGFLVNPHAPSGRLESLDYLLTLADRFVGLLVIDEAYVDFAERDAVTLITQGRDDVILLRSLSKGYALAGLRFGFGVSHPDNIAALDKARDSYNTDILSQVAATAALAHRSAAERTWDIVKNERAKLTAALRRRGFHVFDSQTNFLLVTPPPNAPGAPRTNTPDSTAPATPARAIYLALKRRHILVRYFDTPGLADKLRITLGTPEQNTTLLNALDHILQPDTVKPS